MNSLKLFLILLIFGELQARINPFAPIETIEEVVDSDRDKKHNFSSLDIAIPAESRELFSVTFEFKNIDGTSTEIKRFVDEEVDWRKPIAIKHDTNVSVQRYQKDSKFMPIALPYDKPINIAIIPNNLRIMTNSEILADFTITNPNRIVLDFTKSKIFKVRSFEQDLTVEPFTKIELRNHADFFRVIIFIDSQYNHVVSALDNGYLIGIR